MTMTPTEDESQLALDERTLAPAPATTKPRTGRGPDYRLRGLDLEAPAFNEAPPPQTVRKRHPSYRRRQRRHLVQWIVALAVVALVAVFLRMSVVEPYSVSSGAMAPTLHSGTDVLVLKSHLLMGSLGQGDIVVFNEPAASSCGAGTGSSHELVERVIAGPGQTIRSSGGHVYVDGRRLAEKGWFDPTHGEIGTTKIARTEVPEGSYFVMGDNRTSSCDSRVFGAVPESSVVGKVIATVARDGHPSVHFM
jgi:signal peptidase I